MALGHGFGLRIWFIRHMILGHCFGIFLFSRFPVSTGIGLPANDGLPLIRRNQTVWTTFQNLILRRCPILIWIMVVASLAAAERAVTSVAEFYGLAPFEAAKGRPVRIEGTVLYEDPSWGLLWVQDKTAVLYHGLDNDADVPPVGHAVLINGRTHHDGTQNLIVEASFTDRGQQSPLEHVRLEEEHLQGKEARMVRHEGVVTEAEEVDGHGRMMVSFGADRHLQVFVRNSDKEAMESLLGARVDVGGLTAPVLGEVPIRGVPIHLFTRSMDEVRILIPGTTNRFEVPYVSVGDLIQSFREDRTDLITTSGLFVERSGDMIIAEEEGARFMAHVPGEAVFEKGTWILVSGFPRSHPTGVPFLDRASVKEAKGIKPGPPYRPGQLPVLRLSQAVRLLTREEAARRYPVAINGVVTYSEPSTGICVVNDESGGVMVRYQAMMESAPLPGDQVSVKGLTGMGGFSPVVMFASIKLRGSGEMPTPRRVSHERFQSGVEDSQYLLVDGFCRRFRIEDDGVRLSMEGVAGEFLVWVAGDREETESRPWLGSELRVSGVCQVKANHLGQPVTVTLAAPGVKQVQFLNEMPAEPFALEGTPIDEIMRKVGEKAVTGLIKVEGTVTYSSPGGRW